MTWWQVVSGGQRQLWAHASPNRPLGQAAGRTRAGVGSTWTTPPLPDHQARSASLSSYGGPHHPRGQRPAPVTQWQCSQQAAPNMPAAQAGAGSCLMASGSHRESPWAARLGAQGKGGPAAGWVPGSIGSNTAGACWGDRVLWARGFHVSQARPSPQLAKASERRSCWSHETGMPPSPQHLVPLLLTGAG